MIKAILIVIAIVIAAILIYATTKPANFRIERSVSIKAPADKIFPYINDLHRWSAWSPYENKDPALKRTFSGAQSGVGAVYAYEGKASVVGSGRLEITESTPPSKIVVQLDFLTPMEAHNTGEFTLQANGDTTNVTWAMYGPSNYLSKVMQVFVSFDSMVGNDFQTGLNSLKSAAEK